MGEPGGSAPPGEARGRVRGIPEDDLVLIGRKKILPYISLGAGFGFAAAVQPGPFQAYLIASTMANGWRRTIPACFAPLMSDIPIACMVLFILTQFPPLFLLLLRLAGGIFLLILALGAFRTFRHDQESPAVSPEAVHRTLVKGALVNVLNPNAYLGWSLVMGPLLIEAWGQSLGHAVALIGSFYGVMIFVTMVIVLLFAGARSRGPRVTRILVGLSALALAGFGCYQLWSCAAGFGLVPG